LADIESGTRIEREGKELTFLGYTRPIPDDFSLSFEPYGNLTTDEPLTIFGNNEIQLLSWQGERTLTDTEQPFSITLNWSPTYQLRHEYLAVVQIQTQDFERIAGDEDFVFIQRWLFPSTVWKIDDIVPDSHQFKLPADLQPGAYRIVVAMKYTNHNLLEAVSNIGETVNDNATIGWLKVPQPQIPTLSKNAVEVDVEIGDSFRLSHIEALRLENGQTLVRLYWESLVDRPALDATIFVHATDNGEIAAQSDIRPWNGQYPTFIWDEGEIVVTEHLLTTEALNVSDLNLRVGMYTFPGPQNISAVVHGQTIESGLIELGAFADYLVEN
jgi:hypothetical protein